VKEYQRKRGWLAFGAGAFSNVLTESHRVRNAYIISESNEKWLWFLFSRCIGDRWMAINRFGQRLTIITATGSVFIAIRFKEAISLCSPVWYRSYVFFFGCHSSHYYSIISLPQFFSTINCRVNSFVRSIWGSGTPVGYRYVNHWNHPLAPTTHWATQFGGTDSHSILNASGHPQLID